MDNYNLLLEFKQEKEDTLNKVKKLVSKGELENGETLRHLPYMSSEYFTLESLSVKVDTDGYDMIIVHSLDLLKVITRFNLYIRGLDYADEDQGYNSYNKYNYKYVFPSFSKKFRKGNFTTDFLQNYMYVSQESDYPYAAVFIPKDPKEYTGSWRRNLLNNNFIKKCYKKSVKIYNNKPITLSIILMYQVIWNSLILFNFSGYTKIGGTIIYLIGLYYIIHLFGFIDFNTRSISNNFNLKSLDSNCPYFIKKLVKLKTVNNENK